MTQLQNEKTEKILLALTHNIAVIQQSFFTLKIESVFRVTFFWPDNDGEKWPRKNIFEIPPCGKSFLLNSSIGSFLPKTTDNGHPERAFFF